MLKCTIPASKTLFLAAIMFFLFPAASAFPAKCFSDKGLASNNIYQLQGSGDTLWISALEGTNSFSLNTIAGRGAISQRLAENSNWLSYRLGCSDKWIADIAFGGTRAVALTDTFDGTGEIYSFRVAGESVERKPLKLMWSDDITGNDSADVSALDVVYAKGSFYFACLDGGVVRWNPKSESTDVLVPGSSESVPVEDFTIKGSPVPKRRVTSVNASEKTLSVTSPSKVWLYSLADSSWDTSITSSVKESGMTFKSFRGAFTREIGESRVIYSVMEVSVSGTDTLMFFKYSRAQKGWRLMLGDAPNSLSFATGGYIYMTFEENVIKAYRDTLVDTVLRNPPPAVDRSKFEPRMTPVSYGIDFPALVNDILFVPRTDSSGYLWVATSEGLFFSEREVPGKSRHDFTLIKRAPVVESGLKKSYARPGILTADIGDVKQSRTVFVYNLEKDADVTIRVYDYNMDLVKTIIQNKARKAGKNGGPRGRSTVENEDCWDGSDARGRMVAPGVYYYKINASTGERDFGKIVVAK